LGLSPSTYVASGFLDSAAELIGVGAVEETIGVVRLGSAGGIMVIKRSGKYRKNCLAYPHPVKPFWYYQAGTNACTTSLLWVRNLFSSSSKNFLTPELIVYPRVCRLGVMAFCSIPTFLESVFPIGIPIYGIVLQALR